MRFRRIHRVATYLMVLSSFGALALGGLVDLPVLGLVLLALLVSLFVPDGRQHSLRWQTTWTVTTVVILALCVAEFMLRGELVLTTVNFLLFLLVNKLYNRRSGADDLQLTAITFMMVVAGSVLNIGLSFAVCFVIYVVAATWGLILFHLRREMEENYLIKHASDRRSERVAVQRILESRRIVGPSFLLGTSVASLLVFALAVGTFLFFPRLGGSSPTGRRRGGPGGPLVGFSEEFSLGGYGKLKDNPTPVMRVYMRNRKGRVSLDTLRFRGLSFDKYNAGRWSRSPKLPASPVTRYGHWLVLHHPDRPGGKPRMGLPNPDSLLRQEIYLEPLGTDLLFGIVRPLLLDMRRHHGTDKPRFRLEPGGALRSHLGKTGGRYHIYSDPLPPSPAQLAQTPAGGISAAEQKTPLGQFYLQRPPLHRDVTDLAERLTSGHTTRLAQVQSVVEHLKRFRYTRSLPGKDAEGKSALWHFLIKRQAGHCEYFASAMAILLRVANIPARVVTGFLGGQWNDFGRFLLVRQSDAHAWVEVWFDGIGWVTFDPTPPGGQRRRSHVSGFWNRARLWFESLRMRWRRWVIDYDMDRQFGLLKSLKGSLQRFRRRVTGSDSSQAGLGAAARRRKRLAFAALGVGILLLLGFVFLRRRAQDDQDDDPDKRRRKRRSGSQAHLARLLTRLVKTLKTRGHERQPGQTLAELAREVDALAARALAEFEEDTGPLPPPLAPLVSRYNRLRFSGADVLADEVSALDRDLRAWLKASNR